MRKYSSPMIPLIAATFQSLPLAHVIRGSSPRGVLVLHGGLFSRDDVSLDDIRAIDRHCEPPEHGIMCELLWSDPQPQPGRALNPRGVALCFGPDVTARFLERNGLQLLVRSHQVRRVMCRGGCRGAARWRRPEHSCDAPWPRASPRGLGRPTCLVQTRRAHLSSTAPARRTAPPRAAQVKAEGYEVEAGGKLVTVFSAPNYCGVMGNMGACQSTRRSNTARASACLFLPARMTCSGRPAPQSLRLAPPSRLAPPPPFTSALHHTAAARPHPQCSDSTRLSSTRLSSSRPRAPSRMYAPVAR